MIMLSKEARLFGFAIRKEIKRYILKPVNIMIPYCIMIKITASVSTIGKCPFTPIISMFGISRNIIASALNQEK